MAHSAAACVDAKNSVWCYEHVVKRSVSYCASDPDGAEKRCCATCAEWNRTGRVSRPAGPERLKLECGEAHRRQQMGHRLTAAELVAIADCPPEWTPWWFVSKLQENIAGFSNSTHRTEGEPWARGLRSSVKDARPNMAGWGPWTTKSILHVFDDPALGLRNHTAERPL